MNLRKIIKEEVDEFDWIRDTEQWDPRGKKILIDFENDPNWEGWLSYGGVSLGNKVFNKLIELGYDGDLLKSTLSSKGNICYLFLEGTDRYNNDGDWIVSWDSCESDLFEQGDFEEYQYMTATDFLNYFK